MGKRHIMIVWYPRPCGRTKRIVHACGRKEYTINVMAIKSIGLDADG